MIRLQRMVLCRRALFFLVFLSSGADPVAGEDRALFWQIGKRDNNNAEFALAPKGYDGFREDGFFLVGTSDPKRDWPYVHPGPADVWAGGRSHTFGIAFGLKAAPAAGTCRLLLDLVDTHSRTPPRLRIDVNGRAFDRRLPSGAGDASVYGEPDKGREHKLELDFPASLLQGGNNYINITTLEGSWVLYDWIGLEAPPGAELAPATGTLVQSVRSAPTLVERDGELMQTVEVDVVHLGAPGEASVEVAGAEPARVTLKPGRSTVSAGVPCVEAETEISVSVRSGGATLATRQVRLKPVRKWVVYLLPHSHVDIGYTHVQTDVERSHWQFYEQAIEASKKTSHYPPASQFKWNAEVLWATDSYLRQAAPEKREAFIDAVKRGWIGLDALYGNELTALCRPEELVRLVDFARRLKRRYRVPIESAMISDVPGYTWGIVPVLAQSGVKYFSIGPNGGHRIGYTLSEWGDRPFWWVSPCGRYRVLCWIPRTGYWRGFRGAAGLTALLKRMEDSGYRYDFVQLRHCLGDNAGPGVALSEFVKEWNAKYAYPRLVIATTRQMMRDFEKRYGKELPEVRGDFTPYWEDGAGSSARETAINRAAAERLAQAETLFAMLRPGEYPDEEFYQAWRNVILYDEHTWGAHSSISQPESDFTKAQWAIKQRFALDGDVGSRELLEAAVARRRSRAREVRAVDVFNTCSWTRTDLVFLPKSAKTAGDAVQRPDGAAVASQRLATGELAFLAADVPPLGAKRFTFHAGKAPPSGAAQARAEGARLSSSRLRVMVDERTGAVRSFRWAAGGADLVDLEAGLGLNDYFYVAGRNPDNPQRNGPVKIAVKERGPLVASLIIESEAPGCHKLTRELRVVEGLDRLDITNVVDKQKTNTQEGVHFGFAFKVPAGVMRMDTPWAVVRVEADQIPGACKNYFTVQRWLDISNDELGVTWATVDAPLVEVGAITCDPIRVGWIRTLEPSSVLYSYVMNNYWETNYKAAQEGPTTFRYSIRPHGKYDAAAAQRFGIEQSQPLIHVPVDPETPCPGSLLEVDPDGVIVTTVKPSAGGEALIVRLFNASGKVETPKLTWGGGRESGSVERCDLSEEPAGEGLVEMAPSEVVTCRVTRPAGGSNRR